VNEILGRLGSEDPAHFLAHGVEFALARIPGEQDAGLMVEKNGRTAACGRAAFRHSAARVSTAMILLAIYIHCTHSLLCSREVRADRKVGHNPR